MGPMVELRYYSMLFVVSSSRACVLNWQIKPVEAPEVAGDFIVYGCAGRARGCTRRPRAVLRSHKAIDDPIWVFKIWTGGWRVTARWRACHRQYLFTKSRDPFLEGSDPLLFLAALGPPWWRIATCSTRDRGSDVPD